jgi:hypothetical protein
MVDKWMKKANNPDTEGSLREYFGVKQGDTIPTTKLNATITSLQTKEKNGKLSDKELRLLRQCELALRYRGQ